MGTGDSLKRALDLAIAALLLLILAPLMLLLAAAVRYSSPGPALFRQQRVGRGGRLFWLYKFRTMRADPSGPAITAAGDRRITPIGRWLRRSKLDELPQLLNVLRGEMSLVGPRPEVPRYVERYTPDQRAVLAVRPGITGPSQISFRDEERLLASAEKPEAYYVDVLMPQKLAIDLQYVRHPSLTRDLQLLLRTTLAVWGPGHAHMGKSRKPGRSAGVSRPPSGRAAA